jgi:hypothetical protein
MLLIFDLDRTLNCLHPATLKSVRELAPRHLIHENGPALWEWIANHLNSVEYPVNQDALDVIRGLGRHACAVVVNTGRPETARDATERWLKRFFRVDLLFMRSTADFRPTSVVKHDHLIRNILPIYGSADAYAFEDNNSSLDMYRGSGVAAFAAPNCWQRLSTHIAAAESFSEIERALSIAARSAGQAADLASPSAFDT